ncbi:ADP-ribosylhydrolase ARH3 [Amia ocellicauda]|uniref:ADP-ribosylhydrolase ARH3 n=1 Tax=Amia ocellicauda TaxID=2972642 RepID=UPI00346499AB
MSVSAAAAGARLSGTLGAGGPTTLSRFRGALVGAVLGDCIGGEFEGAEEVPLDRVLQHLNSLEQENRGDAILQYSDDTAMTRCVAQSLLTRGEFDQVDLAHRFAEEYRQSPARGYGAGVVAVLRRLLSPPLGDVFQPATLQFGGRGSFGNGGAMRATPFALAFPNAQDVERFSRLGALLTHSCSLGYNGAVLQALAVHLALQGALQPPHSYLRSLLALMEGVEGDERSLRDARELSESEMPFCARLHKVRELLDRNSVTVEDVIAELGNGIAALQSVPTAIFCVLHCLQPRPELPAHYGGLERTLAFCLALGGDTDTIASMAGAIAGAHYGLEAIPSQWKRCCEGAEEAELWAERLHQLYQRRAQGGDTESHHTDTHRDSPTD